jgi:addiction module RelE/StbE family toxin
MKLNTIKYSPTFIRNFKKFPKSQVKFLKKRELLFRNNPFYPILKTHKLKGELSEFYSFSISYHWRIVFHFIDDFTVVFDSIGTHEVYK